MRCAATSTEGGEEEGLVGKLAAALSGLHAGLAGQARTATRSLILHLIVSGEFPEPMAFPRVERGWGEQLKRVISCD